MHMLVKQQSVVRSSWQRTSSTVRNWIVSIKQVSNLVGLLSKALCRSAMPMFGDHWLQAQAYCLYSSLMWLYSVFSETLDVIRCCVHIVCGIMLSLFLFSLLRKTTKWFFLFPEKILCGCAWTTILEIHTILQSMHLYRLSVYCSYQCIHFNREYYESTYSPPSILIKSHRWFCSWTFCWWIPPWWS